MRQTGQSFGGSWTIEKLDILKEYLDFYVTALKNQPFGLIYIDAFAGTGYIETESSDEEDKLFINDSQKYFDGSTRIALQVDPSFDKYIFIEQSQNRYLELLKLREEFPHLKKKIFVKNNEANACLLDLCYTINWKNYRAVLFLDPYGMQVSWKSIEVIAKTEAVDLWYLFPLGIGVNRLLKRDGKITDTNKTKLDNIFGTKDWYEEFYRPKVIDSLFGDEIIEQEKVTNHEQIAMFFISRLKTCFPVSGVAKNYRLLYNSKNNPLYLFCFACANPRGSTLALRGAEHILKGKLK